MFAGRILIGAVRTIRRPIKWTRKKVTAFIKRMIFKEKTEAERAGLGHPATAWMTFGRMVENEDLTAIFPENVAGYLREGDLIVPYSELAMHSQAAGGKIHAWALTDGAGIIVYEKTPNVFGFIRGLDTEVMTPHLVGLTRKLFK